MKLTTFREILCDELHATGSDSELSLPAGTRVTVFLASGGGVPIPVSKITKVGFREHYVVLGSEEGRVFADTNQVAAIRADEEAGESRVGF